MKGRKPKPTHLKLVQGTYRPDRAPVAEPSPADQLGDAPDHLNDEQRSEWAEILQAAPKGLLTRCDRGLIEGYVVLAAARTAAIRTWNATGTHPIVRAGDRRTMVVNPYLKEIRRLTDAMRTLAAEMGFTPSSRGRIDLGERDAGGQLSKYLDK